MPTDTDASLKASETVSCRPSAVYWVFVAFCAILGVMSWFGAHAPTKTGPPSAADVVFVQSCAAALLATGTALAVWLIRARIVADINDLRWQRFGGWKSARWEEVQDFYDRLPSQGRQTGVSSVIKTTKGNVRFSREWANADALREQVARRATQAAAKEWGIFGSRPCDLWPRVFDYNAWSNRWAARIFSLLLIVFVVYMLATPVQRTISQFGSAGWNVTLVMLGVFILYIFSKGTLFLLVIERYRDAGRRRAERITANMQGIVFEDGERRLAAAWTEVTGYGVTSGRNALMFRYAVETQQGDFDFLGEIKGALLLMAIIRRYVTCASDKEWHLRGDFRNLGGETARWSGRRVGVGARVYHYRTRSYRALLWFPAALCAAWSFLCWATWQGLLPGAQALGPLSAAAVCGLVFLSGWYAYRTCRVETDADGLTQITPLGRRRLAWGQIEDYWLTGEGNGVVIGRGERLWFGKGIVGYEELKEEIARRATECGGREWQQEATRTSRDVRRRGRREPESSARD